MADRRSATGRSSSSGSAPPVDLTDAARFEVEVGFLRQENRVDAFHQDSSELTAHIASERSFNSQSDPRTPCRKSTNATRSSPLFQQQPLQPLVPASDRVAAPSRHPRHQVKRPRASSDHFCPRCKDVFSGKYAYKNLVRHLLQICERENKFVCQHCENEFNRKVHLQAHDMKHHSQEQVGVTCAATKLHMQKPISVRAHEALACGICRHQAFSRLRPYIRHISDHCVEGSRAEHWSDLVKVKNLLDQDGLSDHWSELVKHLHNGNFGDKDLTEFLEWCMRLENGGSNFVVALEGSEAQGDVLQLQDARIKHLQRARDTLQSAFQRWHTYLNNSVQYMSQYQYNGFVQPQELLTPQSGGQRHNWKCDNVREQSVCPRAQEIAYQDNFGFNSEHGFENGGFYFESSPASHNPDTLLFTAPEDENGFPISSDSITLTTGNLPGPSFGSQGPSFGSWPNFTVDGLEDINDDTSDTKSTSKLHDIQTRNYVEPNQTAPTDLVSETGGHALYPEERDTAMIYESMSAEGSSRIIENRCEGSTTFARTPHACSCRVGRNGYIHTAT